MGNNFVRIKIVIIISLILALLSCVTTQEQPQYSELYIVYGANDWDLFSKLNVYIDGVKKAAIKSGKVAKIIVKNGSHIISVDWKASLIGVSIGAADTKTLQFNANANRILFNVNLNDTLREGHKSDRTDHFSYIFDLILTIDSVMSLDGTKLLKHPIEEAIANSYMVFKENLPQSVRIAIINIESEDTNESIIVFEELSKLFVNSNNYIVVERKNIDAVKNEHNFQYSGEIDDETAVSIGHLLGAQVIILGNITSYKSMRRLQLKVIDVESGQIKIISSERF